MGVCGVGVNFEICGGGSIILNIVCVWDGVFGLWNNWNE